jgi:cell division protein FtsA
MKAGRIDKPIVAIDIGTTKICVLVAQPIDGTTFHLLGMGTAPSDGLAKGIVVDVGRTVASIKQAVAEAELVSGISITNACIGISGSHIQSRTSQGMVAIKRGEIGSADIAQVLAAARAVSVHEGQQILQVVPQYFIIDGEQRVQDPLGMYGVRLEAQVHIISGSIACVHNLVRCCELAGVHVSDIVLEQLASAKAVLNNDERMLGVALVDIGGGTSDIALYYNNAIMHTNVIPVAGNHFTRDVAIGLQTSLKDAEEYKHLYGSVILSNESVHASFDVQHIDGAQLRQVEQQQLQAILYARAYELIQLIKHDLQLAVAWQNAGGLVLTGGGALLNGLDVLAQTHLHIPARIGRPHVSAQQQSILESPAYATAYGLLLHALQNHDTASYSQQHGPMVMRIMHRMRSWVADFF